MHLWGTAEPDHAYAHAVVMSAVVWLPTVVVVVAGAGCLTGRSVCSELRRAPGVDLAALAPEELFLATNDDGRTLAADARPSRAAPSTRS